MAHLGMWAAGGMGPTQEREAAVQIWLKAGYEWGGGEYKLGLSWKNFKES